MSLRHSAYIPSSVKSTPVSRQSWTDILCVKNRCTKDPCFILLTSDTKWLNIHFPLEPLWHNTAQKMKFSIKDFFSKCDQICRFLTIWSHLLKKSLLENFIFCSASCTFLYLFSSLLILIPEGFWIDTGGCSKNVVLKKIAKQIGNTCNGEPLKKSRRKDPLQVFFWTPQHDCVWF